MTVKEIADLIFDKKYDYQVTVSGSNFKHKTTKTDPALLDSEKIENDLLKIANYNNAKEIIVRLTVPKGSSSIAIDTYSILIPDNKTVGTVNKNTFGTVNDTVESVNKNTVGTVNNPLNEYQIIPKKTTMQDKDYIDFKVLEVKHNQLEGFYNEAKSKINKLEKKVEDLHDENKQLLRANTTTEDKHAIALERAKLDMEREAKDAKGGLNGVMEFAQENPETVKMLLGALFPNNPNFRSEGTEQKTLEGAPHEIGNIKYTADNGANQVLNDIPLKLSQKDGDTIAKIYMLFQKFMTDETVLNETVKTIIPEYPL